MTDTTNTVAAETVAAATAAQTSPAAGLESAASFADAETREILNLLGDAEAGATCCGGSCCA